MEARTLRSGRMLPVLVVPLLLAAACGINNPFAPQTSASQAREQQLLKFAQCMRTHGINMSDPGTNGAISVNRTIPNGSGSGSGAGAGNTTTAPAASPGPDSNQGIVNDPQMQAAQNACQKYLPSGSKGPGTIDPAQIDQLTRFAQCMRDHGVPVSDPQVGNGRVSMGVNAGQGGQVDKSSAQLQQAQKACQHLMPTPRPGS